MDPVDDRAFFRVSDTVNSTFLTPTVELVETTLAAVKVAGEKLNVLVLTFRAFPLAKKKAQLTVTSTEDLGLFINVMSNCKVVTVPVIVNLAIALLAVIVQVLIVTVPVEDPVGV